MLYTAFSGPYERIKAFFIGGKPYQLIGALTNLKIIVNASILLNIFFYFNRFLVYNLSTKYNISNILLTKYLVLY